MVIIIHRAAHSQEQWSLIIIIKYDVIIFNNVLPLLNFLFVIIKEISLNLQCVVY